MEVINFNCQSNQELWRELAQYDLEGELIGCPLAQQKWVSCVQKAERTNVYLRACLLFAKEVSEGAGRRSAITVIGGAVSLVFAPTIGLCATLAYATFDRWGWFEDTERQSTERFQRCVENATQYYSDNTDHWLEGWNWLPKEYPQPWPVHRISMHNVNLDNFDFNKLKKIHPNLKELEFKGACCSQAQWIGDLPRNLKRIKIDNSPHCKVNSKRIKKERGDLEVHIVGEEDVGKKFRKILNAEIFFQPQAVEGVIDSMILSKRWKSEKTPHGVMLFAGPTGVGKTELARAMAKALDRQVHIINMADYQSEHDLWRFMGSPKGYQNHKEGGKFTNIVKSDPQAMIIFDELEKAHESIFKYLLSLLDVGIIQDNKGEAVDCRDTFLIMTSNLGTSDKGFGKVTNWRNIQAAEKKIRELWEKTSSPECLSRIKTIVPFVPFNRSQIIEILASKAVKICEKIKNIKSINLNIDYSVYEGVVDSIGVESGVRGVFEKMKTLIEGHEDLDIFLKEDKVGAFWDRGKVVMDLIY